MEKVKIDRINELAEIKKQRPLTESELKEKEALYKEYLTEFRQKLRGSMPKGEA